MMYGKKTTGVIRSTVLIGKDGRADHARGLLAVHHLDRKSVVEGKRGDLGTGVQTCALPILEDVRQEDHGRDPLDRADRQGRSSGSRPWSSCRTSSRSEERRGGEEGRSWDWSSDVCSSDLRGCTARRPRA